MKLKPTMGPAEVCMGNEMRPCQVRIGMIGSACENADAEKIIAECRKSYGLGTREGTNLGPTLDKAQAAKILEQEGLLRAAVNYGEGLRVPGDQRQPQSLPSHLIGVLPLGHGAQNLGDIFGDAASNGMIDTSPPLFPPRKFEL